MKTKALLTLGLIAGAFASVQAQTVSQNIVGYVNKTVTKGKFVMLSNPLKATSNKVQDVIKLGDADDLLLYHYNGTTFSSSEASGGAWLNGENVEILPGGGFFATTPTADVKITFVGEVDIAGAQAGHNIPAGLSIQSSTLPKAGTLTALEYPTGDETIFQFLANQSYASSDALGGEFLNGAPTVGVGESFWVKSDSAVRSWKQPSAANLLK